MNQYSWFSRSIYVFGFLIAAATGSYIFLNLISPGPAASYPSARTLVESVDPERDSPTRETKDWRDYYQGIVQAKIGPEQNGKPEQKGCPISSFIKEILNIHKDQGVQVQLQGRRQSTYVLKGDSIFIRQAPSNVWSAESPRARMKITLLDIKQNQAIFRLNFTENGQTTSCEGSMSLSESEGE